MTKTYTALAMEGTPDTPCGMVSLLVETDDGLVSILTPRGPAGNGVTREKFCDLANEGFATWFSLPSREGIEVEKGWYALYLSKELAEVVGGFEEALHPLVLLADDQADSIEHFARIPEEECVLVPRKEEKMKNQGWVIVLGTSQRLWRFRKGWAKKLERLNRADNLRYLKTGKTELSDDLEAKDGFLDKIEQQSRLGLYCTEPEVTPDSYLNFALELGLVMARHRGQDTCQRVYKYHVERYFPRISWDEFERQIEKLREEYRRSLEEIEPQLLEEPVSDGRKKRTDREKSQRSKLWLSSSR
uniref:Uncharacterized protein n=1 Tax=Candidatus Kentrum sp. FW TaxID=2126338 RepID=A0A450TXI9_9GAMM|nr:MAG: hypothetical protein BECKFW1821C_GA0114237_10566 [Candidatus Kentron sp. FW]